MKVNKKYWDYLQSVPTPPLAQIVLGPNLVSGQGSPQCIYLPEELDRRQDILHITISFLNDGYLQKLIMTSFFFLLAQV